jgi:hypothetical protein
MSIELQNGNIAKPGLEVRCFSHEELQAIKTDCFHILKSVDLSKEHKELRDSVIDKIEQELQESKKIWYEYEMFFKSEPNDFCKIDGWYPIATDRIKDIDKVEEYISNGLLRRVSCNNS